MSAHSGSTALIRSDAVTNAAQCSPSLQLGMRVKKEREREEEREREDRGLDKGKSRDKTRALDKR